MPLRRAQTSRRGPELPPVLRAKLLPPNPGSLVLERPRLLRALAEHADRPLTLVVADAGYGKSSLLSAFARSARRPTVWYSLMPSDADLVLFGRYLLEGFRRQTPRFGRSFERALEEARPGGRSAEMLAGTFANELATLRGPRVLLVLDDFQEVAGQPQVVSFMDLLLRHVPSGVRALIASRSTPPLALDRMRARGDLFEMHSGHLRLTRDELGKLFADVYRRPLGEDELTALDETTLGWPTAVHLVHESLLRSPGGSLADVLASFRGSHLELHDYLSSEVYARLDGESRRLLERTAALTRFDPSLAAELSGTARPEPALEALVRRGLLRSFGSGDQVSYECHDLVRRFVRSEIEARDPVGGLRMLESDTAVALAARGEAERALRHTLAAGEVEGAVALLRGIAPLLLRQGRATALRQYLEELPPPALQADLTLSLALADAQQGLGAWDEAEVSYQTVLDRSRGLPASGTHDGGMQVREIECRALLGLGKVLNLRGRYEQVLGMAERGLAVAGDLGLEVRARLLQMKAGAHFYLGQFGAAVRVLDEVREQLGSGADAELLVPTVHNRAIALAAQGRIREASTEFRAVLAHVRGTDSPRAPLYLSNLAFLLADLGDLSEARRAAEEGLGASQRFSNRAQECTCYEALAQILAQSGDLDGALAALKHAEELNVELRMEVIAADLLALRGRIFCERGEYRRAVEFVTQAIERGGERSDSPRLPEFQALLAWCELRAGRVRVARDQLVPLVAHADRGENDAQRMRVHYWLAESLVALGERRDVDAHLTVALRLVRERGLLYFLRVQAREEPSPLVHALASGIEVDTVSAALVEAGASVESALLELLADAPPRVGEAAVSVLGEVGGAATLEGLERAAHARRSLRPAVRTALRHVEERLGRGVVARGKSAQAQPRLLLMGPPRLEIDGRLIPASAWRAQRAFQLLMFLALHPRGASKDELLERFWPGRQAAAGRRNFHPTLSYVRSVLPTAAEPPILREGEFYRLNPAYPLSCDAWEFDRALNEARAARDSVARRAALERALLLVTGPFLQGTYAEWAGALEARHRERVEEAMLDLGHLRAAVADFGGALEAFRRASEIDEYREATRLAVIECLVRMGNRRAALAEYEKLREVLRQELGVEPLPETEEAIQRLLAGKSVHGWSDAETATMAQASGPQKVIPTGQARLKAARAGSPR